MSCCFCSHFWKKTFFGWNFEAVKRLNMIGRLLLCAQRRLRVPRNLVQVEEGVARSFDTPLVSQWVRHKVVDQKRM